MTGLRPIRSDQRPNNGAQISWASEKEANKRPTVRPDAPNRSAYRPRIGTMIPNPMRSSATVVQMVQYPLGTGLRSRFATTPRFI